MAYKSPTTAGRVGTVSSIPSESSDERRRLGSICKCNCKLFSPPIYFTARLLWFTQLLRGEALVFETIVEVTLCVFGWAIVLGHSIVVVVFHLLQAWLKKIILVHVL